MVKKPLDLACCLSSELAITETLTIAILSQLNNAVFNNKTDTNWFAMALDVITTQTGKLKQSWDNALEAYSIYFS